MSWKWSERLTSYAEASTGLRGTPKAAPERHTAGYWYHAMERGTGSDDKHVLHCDVVESTEVNREGEDDTRRRMAQDLGLPRHSPAGEQCLKEAAAGRPRDWNNNVNTTTTTGQSTVIHHRKVESTRQIRGRGASGDHTGRVWGGVIVVGLQHENETQS